MRRKASLLLILPFFLGLFGLGLLGLLLPDQEKSWSENRWLAPFPEWDSAEPRAFSIGVESYVVDHFPGREALLKLYTRLQLALGKQQVRDAFVVEGGWLFIPDRAADLSGLTERFFQAVEQNPGPAYCFAALPTKAFCLGEVDPLLETGAGERNLQALEQAFSGSSVCFIDLARPLRGDYSLAERKSQWFPTDFHWNAAGAYAAMERLFAVWQEVGLVEPPLDASLLEWSWPEQAFQGDLNRRFSNLFPLEQAGPVIRARAELRCFSSREKCSPIPREQVFGSGLAAGMELLDYNSLYSPNLAYLRIENESAPEKKKLLLLKDSMSNSCLEILAAHFQQVEVVDARFAQDAAFSDLAAEVDVVLLMLHQNNPAPETQAWLLAGE